MSSDDSMRATSLPIVEVGELCATVATSSRRLLELAGQSIGVVGAGSRQRRFAAACDRHAWHLDLAIERSPRIPLVPAIESETAAPVVSDDPAGDWERDTHELRDRLLATYPRLQPELDPATARLIQLVVSDLDELLQLIGTASD